MIGRLPLRSSERSGRNTESDIAPLFERERETKWQGEKIQRMERNGEQKEKLERERERM